MHGIAPEKVRTFDGKLCEEAMYADGRPGWHSLGYTWEPGVVPNSEQVEECMPSLFFPVKKEAIQLVDTRGGTAPAIEDHFALVRQDTGKTLHVVGNDYEVWQNRDAFNFLDSLQMDGVIKYETCIILKGGKQVVLLARLPGADTVAEGDHSFRYVLCTFSHGGGAIILTPTSIRVECWNLLQMALSGSKHKYSIRHSGNLEAKLKLAKEYISQFDSQFTDYRKKAEQLVKPYTEAEAIAYIDEMYPKKECATKRGQKAADTRRKNKLKEVRQHFKSRANQLPSIKGTWWQLFNAVTETVDHGKRQERGKSERDNMENRFMAITSGPQADFKTKAFETALTMAL